MQAWSQQKDPRLICWSILAHSERLVRPVTPALHRSDKQSHRVLLGTNTNRAKECGSAKSLMGVSFRGSQRTLCLSLPVFESMRRSLLIHIFEAAGFATPITMALFYYTIPLTSPTPQSLPYFPGRHTHIYNFVHLLSGYYCDFPRIYRCHPPLSSPWIGPRSLTWTN